jgi:hypothetical protein
VRKRFRSTAIPPHIGNSLRLCGGSLFLQGCIPEERTPQEGIPQERILQERAAASVAHVSDAQLHLMHRRF